MKHQIPGHVAREIGSLFQELTKYHREDPCSGVGRKRSSPPPLYKAYPGAPTVDLPEPETEGGPPVWRLINRRRSRREFSRSPLSINELSQLTWAIQGLTGGSRNYPLRAAPSAGALYPVETYLSVHNVEAVEPGIYHYRVGEHRLEKLRDGHHGDQLARAGLEQYMLSSAACVFIWTAVVGRSEWKYGQRAYRYIYLDAGHLGGNLHLAAEALNLGTCMVGALYDDLVNELLGVDGIEETVIYMAPVGRCYWK